MSDQSNEKPEILVIDDSKVIRSAAVKMLGDEYTVHQASDGKAGLEVLLGNPAISVVFTDMQMPVMSGLELLASIRESEDERIANIPVIMITGQSDSEETKKEVFDLGATDFIGKPFGSIDLLSRARAYAQLNRKVAELEQQTGHDKITGLFNDISLEEQGDKALAFAIRHRLNISTVYFEIDEFQDLFLDHGKAVAQQIIVAVAKRLAGALRTEDVAARMGVAKFAVLLPLTNNTHAKIVVDRIRESINKLVFDTGKEKLRIVLAAGMTCPEIEDDLKYTDMMTQADTALKRALEKAGDKIASYVEEEELNEVIELPPAATEDDLKQAFDLILEEEYFKIERDHLDLIMIRLAPFLAYVENLEDEFISGDDTID
jgi:two-component system cell cycle response regulator